MANIKTRRVKHDQLRNELGKIQVKNQDYVAGSPATYIMAGDLVSVASKDGGHLTVSKVVEGTVKTHTQIMVAIDEIREYGRVAAWYIITDINTLAQSVGDPVSNSTTTPGGYDISNAGTVKALGKVLVDHATEGVIILRPLV
jgi:hypothetical protein